MNIPFQNPDDGGRVFSRVLEQLRPGLGDSLRVLLQDSPDPDGAILLFERFITESPEALQLFEQHHFLAHYALVVFGHSRFLGETLIHNVDLLHAFLREKNLDRSFSRDEFHESLARFRARSFESDVPLLLAAFKRREYVRIMLRDVLKLAPLAETTAEISGLSDVIIEDALREAARRLERRFGTPQHLDAAERRVDTPFTVLSLGKLGGNELNYSSDVDLLYIFGSGAEPPGVALSNAEYFVRLAQETTEILSTVTREGQPFRIDLRLRPQGNEGELAISLTRALRYYAESAHDWEKQALIKLRYSAGDRALARDFMRGVQPHVYTESVNFAAIKTALQARERMQKRRRKQSGFTADFECIDVKIDRGGIRDVEFLVQCLQRVYGGAELWLRSRGTLFALQKLHDKQHISGKEFHTLSTTYEFLRHLEHRLQLQEGQQTHRLPISGEPLRVVQRAMEGYAPGEDRGVDLVAMVKSRMAAVAEIYQRVVYQQNVRSQFGVQEAPFRLESVVETSAADQSNQQILERLSTDAPALHAIIKDASLSLQARRNLFRFLSSALTSSERYAAVLRESEGLKRALVIFDSSEYLSDILIRHPEEIVTLAELSDEPSVAPGGYLFETLLGHERVASDPVFSYLVQSDAPYGEKLSLLRRHYRHRVLAAGAKDLSDLRSVYTSLGITTAAAEDAIAAAYGVACSTHGLAVMAMGRLGAHEFDALSDADVLFVCEDGCDLESQIKTAGQMMQALAAYTRDGTVFPVDARLRPRGNEGELVITASQLHSYFESAAQPWEALMYTKLRFLAGSRPAAERALRSTGALFTRFANDADFLGSIREMRDKLESAEHPEKNFKTCAGGSYDIDFLTGYLLVKCGIREKAGTLRDRIWRCASYGVLPRTDAAVLDRGAEFLRTLEHVIRLVVGRARKWLPATEHAQATTERLVQQILGYKFRDGLEAELTFTLTAVRAIYARALENAPSAHV